MILLLGKKIKRIRIILGGADISYCGGKDRYLDDILIAMAGPLTSLITAVAWADHSDYFAGINVILCLFNLLPIYPLDGGRAAEAAISYFAGPYKGEKLIKKLSFILTVTFFSAALASAVYNRKAVWSAVIFACLLLSLYPKKTSNNYCFLPVINI